MINLKEARHVIAAAEAKAHEIGQPMNIAVVDTVAIQNSNHGRIMIFAGGAPLRRNGSVIGAISGSGSQDQAVAMAGASAFVDDDVKAKVASLRSCRQE